MNASRCTAPGRRQVATLIAACLIAAPLAASGDDSKPVAASTPSAASIDADKHFRAGVAAFTANDLRIALHEFESAQASAPHARTLFNIGAVHAELGDRARALDAYERGLGDTTGQTSSARRAEVEREVALLRTQVATLVVTCPRSGAEVRLDGERVGTTPLPSAFYVNAGVHRLEAIQSGRVVATRAVTAAGGATVGVEIAFDADAAPSSAPPQGAGTGADPARDAPPKGDPAILPWVLWGGTGALAVATTVAGVLALDQSSRLAHARNQLGASHDDLVARDGRVRDFASATDVLLIATAATACAAVYVTLLRPSARTPARSSSLAGSSALAPTLSVGLMALRLDASF